MRRARLPHDQKRRRSARVGQGLCARRFEAEGDLGRPRRAVAGQTLSLNEIEHGVIRTRWDEPRVHACVNCASRSCPDLLGQAYRGDDRLDDQLTAQFKLWLRDETKGLTLDDAKKPMLSRIFLWYAGDFETRGGSPAYAAQYAPAGAARDALATMAPSYFAYDWNLNTQ